MRLEPLARGTIRELWLADRETELTHLEMVDEIEDEYLIRIELDADTEGVLMAIADR